MENKMVQRLQTLVDHIREAKEIGDEYSEKVWQEYYRYAAAFTEDVTGKTVDLHSWKVTLK